MTHRHFPRYNDDADFTTNAPSYYEDLARKEKLIRLLAERIWGYEKILDETLEEIQERFRAWDKNLEDFPEDVKILLQQWLDDGTLDHIINDTIFNWKLDTTIFEQFRDTTTAQLQQKAELNQVVLTPEIFNGSDVEKLQQALDYAIENNHETIYLNKSYDITDGTLYMPETSFWGRVTFQGGKIVKNSSGYIFDSLGTGTGRNSPILNNVTLETNIDGVYVFNGNKMIRQEANSCMFYKIGFVKADDYLQTIRLHQCETGILGGHFIDAQMGFDIEITHHKGEQTPQPYHFINLVTEQPNAISFFSLRINSSLLEGYTLVPPINLGTGYGLSIMNSYFEANNGSIVISKGVGTSLLSGEIRNCVFGANKSEYDIFLDKALVLTKFFVETNTTNAGKDQYLTNRNIVKNFLNTNNVYSGGRTYPSGVALTRDTSYTSTQIEELDGSPTFEIPLQLGGVTIGNAKNRQFLLNAQATYSTSAFYKAHLTAVVSVDGFYSTENTALVNGLNITAISTRNTSGNNNGNLSNTLNVEYYFKETGTKEIDPTATIATLVVKFPKLKFHVNNTCVLKELNGVIQEYWK